MEKLILPILSLPRHTTVTTSPSVRTSSTRLILSLAILEMCIRDRDAAEALRADLEDAYPACDIELQYGGQPIYYYTVSVE